MRERTWQKRMTVFLAIVLSAGMVILPMLSRFMRTSNTSSTPEPTTIPTPTVPAPPDTSAISFDQIHLQSTGLFTVAVPTGWTVSNEFGSNGEAQLTMQNPHALSVLEVRVLAPAEGVTLDNVNNLGKQFTKDWLSSTWRQYSTWREDTREPQGDKLVIDFSLTRSGQNYVARQIAYTDGTWIYAVRLVLPSNASEVMQYILDNEVASLKPVQAYLGEPLSWNAYYDHVNYHLIRFPGTWAVTDSANGVSASIAGDNVEMRVQTSSTIDSSDAATAYVSGLHSGTQIESVESVEQNGLSGYRVSYLIPTLDGPTQSGIVLILDDGSGMAHIANAIVTDAQNTDLDKVDLTSADTAQNIKDLRASLDTFAVFPNLELSSNG